MSMGTDYGFLKWNDFVVEARVLYLMKGLFFYLHSLQFSGSFGNFFYMVIMKMMFLTCWILDLIPSLPCSSKRKKKRFD